jgi:hypothetical protein
MAVPLGEIVDFSEYFNGQKLLENIKKLYDEKDACFKICKICKAPVPTKGGNSSGLHSHALIRHTIIAKKREAPKRVEKVPGEIESSISLSSIQSLLYFFEFKTHFNM